MIWALLDMVLYMHDAVQTDQIYIFRGREDIIAENNVMDVPNWVVENLTVIIL